MLASTLVACAAGQGAEYESADIAVAAATGPAYTRDAGELGSIQASQANRVSDVDAGVGVGVNAMPDAAVPRAAITVCIGKKTRSTCDACCRTAFPKGVVQCATDWWKTFGACACEATGVCRAACESTFCKGAPAIPGSACEACLNVNDACREKAFSGAPDCDSWTRCESDSGCATK